MKLLEERIKKDGEVRPGDVLKVDAFLNHLIDPQLTRAMAAEFARLFAGSGANKILTIESSGIALACVTAQVMDLPLLFAKKVRTSNIDSGVYRARALSYTAGQYYEIVASREYLGGEDRVLIIDDFLARGEAVFALLSLAAQAGASVAGCGVAVEKGFQPGGQRLRESGLHLESLAIVERMAPPRDIEFRPQPHQR